MISQRRHRWGLGLFGSQDGALPARPSPQVQNAKTYVHVRIRADGPTKVLELFEGGEEDFDEKENKYELSSTASASSDSPTASETSTNAFDSLTSGMALHLRLDGIGISCVNELPWSLCTSTWVGSVSTIRV